jgi:hypothetical protein
MPSSVNGFGTKYYGERDHRSDGSYLTTNFFCLAFVPVIPLHTVRVIPDPKNSAWPFSQNYYVILEKRWPHPLQVLNVYLWGAAEVAMGIFYFAWCEPLIKANPNWSIPEWGLTVIFFLFLVPPILISLLLKNMASKQAKPNIIDANDNTPIG